MPIYKKRQYKTVVSKKVQTIIKDLGLDVRIGRTPFDAGIMIKLNKGEIACYFGQGVIWLRDMMPYDKHDQQIVILHEIGHAIITHFFDSRNKTGISRKMHEVKANAAALVIASLLRLPMSVNIVRDFARFTKIKGLKI